MSAAEEPLIWRIPPWQPALLFLVTSAVAALNIYGNPSSIVRGMTILLGLLTFTTGVAASRMYLVVDEQGIGIRRILRETSIEWSDVADVELVELRHGNATVRIERRGAKAVDVPPSLLQPTIPTATTRAVARLADVTREIRARMETHRG